MKSTRLREQRQQQQCASADKRTFTLIYLQNMAEPGMWAGNTSNMHTPPGKGDPSTTGIFAGEGSVHCSFSLCAACEKCQQDHSVISVLGLPPEYGPDTGPRFCASRFWCRWMVRNAGNLQSWGWGH